jgi:hypothetical protein
MKSTPIKEIVIFFGAASQYPCAFERLKPYKQFSGSLATQPFRMLKKRV